MEAKDIFYQIADAVSYLHGRSICHRDLKCENILIRRDQSVALTDFGFSKRVSEQDPLSKTYCGSAAYASPELLRGKPYNPFVTDIWSLGCVLFVVISGQMPFYEKSTKKMMCRQLQGRVVYPEHCSVSKTCKDLVNKTLEPNIDRRVDITGVLSHQWLIDQSSRFLSNFTVKPGLHLLARGVCSDVKKVESLGFSPDSTDEDGRNVWTNKSSSHSTGLLVPVDELNDTLRHESEESCQVHEYTRRVSPSVTDDNQSKGNKEIVLRDVKKISGSTKILETPIQHSNSKPDETASCKKVPANIRLAANVQSFNKDYIPEDEIDVSINVTKVEKGGLTRPARFTQGFNAAVNGIPLASTPTHNIDPSFQRDIENILRVPVTKHCQKRSNACAESRKSVLKRLSQIKPPLAVIRRESTSLQPFETNKLAPKDTNGQSKIAPENEENFSETPCLPFNRYSKPGNSKKDDIASERFHVRQEGLVAQMRRIFESRDATTNTQLTRTKNEF